MLFMRLLKIKDASVRHSLGLPLSFCLMLRALDKSDSRLLCDDFLLSSGYHFKSYLLKQFSRIITATHVHHTTEWNCFSSVCQYLKSSWSCICLLISLRVSTHWTASCTAVRIILVCHSSLRPANTLIAVGAQCVCFWEHCRVNSA